MSSDLDIKISADTLDARISLLEAEKRMIDMILKELYTEQKYLK